ncbi:MAG: MerR family transcriptional regulator [Verrucomicrobiales bacterium]|nr:MerR family transcriptional regulator [Verrucomicrobiales bacterium]
MENQNEEIFEISAVARLTGISSHVLRVWERRYNVVEPRRSDSKRRQYNQLDIRRLSLLKTLVDNGHSIGSVAGLTTSQLEERLASVMASSGAVEALEEVSPVGACRIGLVGTIVRQAVREAADNTNALRVVGEFTTLTELLEALRPGSIDLLIVEYATLFEDEIRELQEAVSKMNVRRAILVYRFAQEDLIQQLDLKKIAALRGPVDSTGIQMACHVEIQLALRTGEVTDDPELENAGPHFERPSVDDIPPRKFSDEELVRIAARSALVKCECPQHLTSLLSDLSAFERYSEQCEDRSPEDAALHGFLHRTTAECRSRMENALSEVLIQEGISL